MLASHIAPTEHFIHILVHVSIGKMMLLGNAIIWQHQILHLIREHWLQIRLEPSIDVFAKDAVFEECHHRFVSGFRCVFHLHTYIIAHAITQRREKSKDYALCA